MNLVTTTIVAVALSLPLMGKGHPPVKPAKPPPPGKYLYLDCGGRSQDYPRTQYLTKDKHTLVWHEGFCKAA